MGTCIVPYPVRLYVNCTVYRVLYQSSQNWFTVYCTACYQGELFEQFSLACYTVRYLGES